MNNNWIILRIDVKIYIENCNKFEHNKTKKCFNYSSVDFARLLYEF